MLEALKDLRHKLEFEADLERSTAAPSWLRWIRSPTALVLVLLVAAFALALPFYRHRNLATSSPPEKSIAVLPFENLSKDKKTRFSPRRSGRNSDGPCQDCRSESDQPHYRSCSTKAAPERNLQRDRPTIRCQQTWWKAVSAEPVTRCGSRCELMDTRTDTTFGPSITIAMSQTCLRFRAEIAQKIADQLRSKLSPAEKAESRNGRPQTQWPTPTIQRPKKWTSRTIGRARKKPRTEK